MSIPFCKFHGFGNDYIVIESEKLPAGTALPALARAICNRHTGAGSDGIAVLERLDGTDADFACEIVNPDGSIAGFSGNGTRCAIAYLHYMGIWSDADLRLRTRSGVKNYHLLSSSGRHFEFRAEIGKPRFSSSAVPFATDTPLEFVLDREVSVCDQSILVSAVNVGNPVACIFVESFDFDWRCIGREMEVHPIFPDRANIVFVKVVDKGNIELRIWERGAGETSASGTCSGGAAVLCAQTGRTGRNVAVQTPGGTTAVVWRDDDEMILTGTADLAYSGQWP
ncbi:diaminopimelate epimerase [soil metagenome]